LLRATFTTESQSIPEELMVTGEDFTNEL